MIFIHIPKCGGMFVRDYFIKHDINKYHHSNINLIINNPNTPHITVLREPIARVYSAYYFQKDRYKKDNVNYINMSFEDWLKYKRGFGLDNMMTRFLAPGYLGQYIENNKIKQWDYETYKPVTEEHLHKAIRNLELFNYIGFLNTLSSDLYQITKLFNLNPNRRSKNFNVTIKQPLTKKQESMIIEREWADIILYKEAQSHAANRFDRING